MDCTFRSHELRLVDVGTKTDYKTIFVSPENLVQLLDILAFPEHLQLFLIVVGGEYVSEEHELAR